MKYFFSILWLYHIMGTGSLSLTIDPNLKMKPEIDNTHLNQTEAPRVLFGKPTSHKYFPFLISLMKYAYDRRRWNYQCGGSLVIPTAVITAAHCVVHYPQFPGAACRPVAAGSLSVVGGADNVFQNSPFKQWYVVQWIETHPRCVYYQESVISWDTAVVTLAKAFTYNEQIQPLRLFSLDAQANLNEFARLAMTKSMCYVVGYGDTGTTRISSYIMSGEMLLMTNEACEPAFCRISNNMCGMNLRRLGMACTSTSRGTPCKGDSGGPLVCNGCLFGTVSWGMGCFSDSSNMAVFGNMEAVTFMVNRFRSGNIQRSVNNTNNACRKNVQLSYWITLLVAILMYLPYPK